MVSENPINGFQVDPADIQSIGRDLQRPECILAEPDGTLPNGLAFTENGDILISNFNHIAKE